MTKIYSKITGIGHYLPSKVMTNADFEKMVDTNDEWIKSRTGISERRFTTEGESVSTMSLEASKKAIERAGITPNDIDMIIVGTVTGDMRFPSTATLIHKGLGIDHPVPAFDISAACSGFVYGLTIADGFIKSQTAKTILVIGSENLSKFTDMQDRNTCVLFGDGAGAAIVQESTEPGILSYHIAADGNYSHLIELPAGGSKMPASEETVKNRMHFTRMEGRETYKQACQDMTETAFASLEKAGLSVEDVTWLVPHQANIRIIQTVTKRLKIDPEKVYTNVDHVGNTSAGSIPIGLSEMFEKGLLKKGDIVVLSALGSGLTWGSVVFKF